MGEESLRAMAEIAGSMVDLAEVQEKTGDAIAGLTQNEGAYISNGAAGGLMICAAACMALDSEEAYRALPESGTRREIILQRAQHNRCCRSGTGKCHNGKNGGNCLFHLSWPGRLAAAGTCTGDWPCAWSAGNRGCGGAEPSGGKPVAIYTNGSGYGNFQRGKNTARAAGFRSDSGTPGMDCAVPALGSAHRRRMPLLQNLP